MAGYTGRKARANAEARRIAAEFGLGRHVKAWRRGSKVTEWALACGFLIGLPVVTATLALTARGQPASLPVLDYVALGMVLSLPTVIGWRHRWLVLYEFEAGLASVSRYRRRVTVLRWADLAAVREDTGQDQDGDWHFYGYLLEDHAGNKVAIGKRAPELLARAEQVRWPSDRERPVLPRTERTACWGYRLVATRCGRARR